MSLISRLYDFVSQTRIKSAEVDNEFNQLINAHNAHDASIDALEAEDISLQADIDAANTTAGNAVTTAESAVTTADNAVTTAGNAVTTANAAGVTAASAVSTANSAVGIANAAGVTAANAVDIANAADAVADGAVVVANGVKDDYEATEPILLQAVADAEAAVLAVASKASVAYVDAVAASFALGAIPDGSLGTVKFQPYSISRLNKDANGIYTEIQFIRADSTLEAKSVLSGGTTPTYTTRTETYYMPDGVTVRTTVVYALSYTGNDLTGEVIQ